MRHACRIGPCAHDAARPLLHYGIISVIWGILAGMKKDQALGTPLLSHAKGQGLAALATELGLRDCAGPPPCYGRSEPFLQPIQWSRSFLFFRPQSPEFLHAFDAIVRTMLSSCLVCLTHLHCMRSCVMGGMAAGTQGATQSLRRRLRGSWQWTGAHDNQEADLC